MLEALGFEGLVERERSVQPPGPRQVLIEMRAASLNYRDLKLIRGTYSRTPELPIIPLSDGAGVVVEVGHGVSRFRPGDRVMPIYMEGWHTGPMTADRRNWKSKAGDVDGVATSFAVYDEEDVVDVPASLTDEEAACFPCAGVTAWHALVCLGSLGPGDTVLVMGSGGVSIFSLQIARMLGARVIALSGDDDKLARLRALGASEGFNYRRTPDWGGAVREVTGNRGVDVTVEVGGAETIRRSIAATRDGGRISAVGDLSGAFPSGGEVERGVVVTRLVVGSREMTHEVLRAFDRHAQKPVIDTVFDMADLRRSLRYLEAGRHFGKVCLRF